MRNNVGPSKLVFAVATTAAIVTLLLSCEKKPGISDPDDPVDSTDIIDLRSAVVKQLDSLLFELVGSDPSFPQTDLAALQSLGAAQVVGMGEATHGTREFFLMKHRIFRYLVEQHGFRVFAIEADIGESYFIDRYIQGENFDLDTLIRKTMLYATWRAAEVRDLIQWMRNTNVGRPASERLRYVGIECQYYPYHASILESYLAKAAPELLDHVRGVMGFARWLSSPVDGMYANYQILSSANYSEVRDSVMKMRDLFTANQGALIAGSSAEEFAFMMYVIQNLLSSHETMYALVNTSPRPYGLRDAQMALNVQRVRDLFAPGLKVAVWAHNVHVSNKLGGFANYVPVMGYQLRQALGVSYQIIGFSFTYGKFMAFTNVSGPWEPQTLSLPPPPGSLNEVFHQARVANFILRMSDIPPATPLDTVLTEGKPMMMFGAGYAGPTDGFYIPFAQRTAFDVMIHFDATSASTYLQRIGSSVGVGEQAPGLKLDPP
jgi:erythromycin esterase